MSHDFLQIHHVLWLAAGVSACQQVKDCHSESPQVSHFSSNFALFGLEEHFRRKEKVRSHIGANQVILLIFDKRWDTKVDEHSLVVVIDDNVVRLDVSVDDFNNFVAVI